MLYLLFGLIFIYGVVIIRRLFAWQRLPPLQLKPEQDPVTTVSVIIPVRNEASNIERLLQDLAKQNFPPALTEILIIDDHSEDETVALVKKLALNFSFKLTCIRLTEQQGTGKKAAVRTGISHAKHELLVFTDGDCRVQPNWLRLTEYFYNLKKAKFISGPVCFSQPQGIFEKMQAVEFAGLIGIGASSIKLGAPNMCNGANMAYPKNIFTEVNGFSGNEHLASGDDEFLMHKVHAKYPGSVYFLKAPAATVFTQANTSFGSFFKQRVRWASKWPAYTNRQVQVLAFLVFSVNLVLFGAGLLAAGQLFPWPSFLLALGLKGVIDFLFLRPVLQFFNISRYMPYLLPLQLVNIPYVIITALLALRGAYSWKGRKIKS